jgi:hypothetical protein
MGLDVEDPGRGDDGGSIISIEAEKLVIIKQKKGKVILFSKFQPLFFAKYRNEQNP